MASSICLCAAASLALQCEMLPQTPYSFGQTGFKNQFGLTGTELDVELAWATKEDGRDVVFVVWPMEGAYEPCEIVVACHKDIGIELLRGCIPVSTSSSKTLRLYAPQTGELVSISDDGRIRRKAMPAGWNIDRAIRRAARQLAKVSIEMGEVITMIMEHEAEQEGYLSANDNGLVLVA